ncbi:MAG: MaoC/PaaZ C-terminal domain-containing protein [Desulfatibacillaceae bacterium]|nr:MaoC/PaaZ C-terminal domain-containing protein [Desulfatibacillaceae bacterium]
MTTYDKADYKESFVVKGKLALPYQYFAGRTGSKFLIALRDKKKILGVRCNTCKKVFVPPRQTCEKCFEDLSENWVELSDKGVVTDFTVVRYAEPHQPVKPPYILAMIKLDGADTPFAHIVRGVAPSKMKEGLKVQAQFAKKTTSTIMDIECFRPASGQFELGYSYDELEIGMSASFTKTITETDVYLFAGISGDFNPMHLNEEFAKKTPFGTRIAHGALPQSLIASVLGMKLPGLGTVALEINTRFLGPTYFGDTVTASAEVIEKLEKKRWVRLELRWINQHGKLIGIGDALVIPPAPAG